MSATSWYFYNRLAARAGARLPDAGLAALADELDGADALEIGGPTALFGAAGLLPIYARLAALDACNYADEHLWSEQASFEGASPRRTFISEATRLDAPDGAYDAVLASHVIEHTADPLRALREWQRVLRPGGAVLLVVPHRDGTFDHRRPPTPIEHLRADARAGVDEDDDTHYAEAIALHDLRRDPGASGPAAHAGRVRDNIRTRALHHHVFDTRTALEMCAAAGLRVERVAARRPFHIICLARRADEGRGAPVSLRSRSPFPSDRGARSR